MDSISICGADGCCADFFGGGGTENRVGGYMKVCRRGLVSFSRGERG